MKGKKRRGEGEKRRGKKEEQRIYYLNETFLAFPLKNSKFDFIFEFHSPINLFTQTFFSSSSFLPAFVFSPLPSSFSFSLPFRLFSSPSFLPSFLPSTNRKKKEKKERQRFR
eukprot:TRINITY_DN1807_c0_g3_i2.p1 TRINITY_DN1807_c0_g3~~TRINITY_DN1807_c0_g3_i2.p1  ORF type:complete len:112 (+),score=47.94 TRINITY_DN1807_c0_g3_i2:84-419(+)